MRILEFITFATSSIQAIGFSDFGWSNRADNMQQDLTLAQCKSKFRIFQPCRIGWAPEEWNEGQCVPKRDRSGEVVEGADWCNFERVPLCEIFSIETGEKLKVVNRHYCDANLGLFKLHTITNSERCQTESGVSCTKNGYSMEITQERFYSFGTKIFIKNFHPNTLKNLCNR